MKLLLTIAGLGVLTSGAFATDLWNQQAKTGGHQLVNDSFTDQPSISTFSVSDVIANANWNINSISIIVSASNTAQVKTITSGLINIYSNAGSSSPLASNDPTTGMSTAVSVTAITGTTTYLVTASNLNINLAKGEYWIGLTPVSSYASQGETFAVYGAQNAAGANYATNYRNPQNGFGQGAGWNTAGTIAPGSPAGYESIDIQGVVQPAPEPISTAIVIGALGTAIAKRRKRA